MINYHNIIILLILLFQFIYTVNCDNLRRNLDDSASYILYFVGGIIVFIFFYAYCKSYYDENSISEEERRREMERRRENCRVCCENCCENYRKCDDSLKECIICCCIVFYKYLRICCKGLYECISFCCIVFYKYLSSCFTNDYWSVIWWTIRFNLTNCWRSNSTNENSNNTLPLISNDTIVFDSTIYDTETVKLKSNIIMNRSNLSDYY